jgi:long-chain acyl-CoA synthetase
MDGPQPGTPEHWARIRPDAPAVINGDAVMTYGEWNDGADRVAEGLAAAGLRAGDRIGMRFHLGLPWFVVQRAMQKLGVEQVAVNWKLTPGEAVYILRDSRAKGLACDDLDAARWAVHDVGLLVTVGQPAGAPGLRYEDLVATSPMTPRFGPLRPRMILYTSGTTGAPKGVPPPDPTTVDLERLRRYRASVGGVPPLPRDAICLMTLPVHHGAGPAAATGACARGGTAIVLDLYDPEEALRLIDRYKVQAWGSVPTMLLRIKALPEHVLDRYDLSSITALSTGAAPVPQSLKEWIVERLGEGVLWEAYGVSEAGMISYTAPEYQLTRPGTCGIAYDGVEIAVVDDEWNRLPPGATGEIAVNTPTAFTLYLGQEPPGENTLKDGFYRTGDVGHLDADGFLFITDRIKDMIVAGGVNIYPAEIEKALVEHPHVIDAAVIGIPEPDFGEQPLAFIVSDPGVGLTADDLLSFLDGRLAPFKKPRQFEFVKELPLSPIGKVLKTELRAPYWQGRDRRV